MQPDSVMAALLRAEAVRERCHELLAACERGVLAHFVLDTDRLAGAADYVADEVRGNYPSLDIPFHSRWRHFEAGGIDRITPLLAGIDGPERARIRFDLAITSVLLDAGAGAAWRWREPGTGLELARSEGLGVASLHLFASGALSSDPGQPLRADADGLSRLTAETVARVFQVDDTNPLAGLDGRVALLHALGDALRAHPEWFGEAPARPGNLFDALTEGRRSVLLGDALRAVLHGLGAIWPGRIAIEGVNLGDVWRHCALVRADATHGLVPFHKLSQWLTYSLVEPMLEAGVEVTGVDTLTGLAEYRNGGLFIDLGVLALRDPRRGGNCDRSRFGTRRRVACAHRCAARSNRTAGVGTPGSGRRSSAPGQDAGGRHLERGTPHRSRAQARRRTADRSSQRRHRVLACIPYLLRDLRAGDDANRRRALPDMNPMPRSVFRWPTSP